MKVTKIRLSSQACGRLFALVSLIIVVAMLQPSLAPEAQAAAAKTRIEPTTFLTVESAQVRTRKDMEQAEAASRGRVPQRIDVPFRPTMSDAEYKEAKAAAAGGTLKRSDVSAPAKRLASAIAIFGFPGADQITSGGALPPDTHGAIGLDQFVEVTNSSLDVYDRSGTSLLNVSLASFFGYFTRDIFDPRAVYDSVQDRWVITAEAFPESPTVQRHFIAASQTSDATGSYFIYGLDVNVFNNDDFWDYPQLGLDQNCVIITANIFGPIPPGMFREARTFAVGKDRLYNGLGFSVRLFGGLLGSPAPPMVLDDNPKTFLVAARPGPTTITKYTLENCSQPDKTTLFASSIAVPPFSIPPDAVQCSTTARLDSSDARFVNASTQVGDSLWNVHTIDFMGFPTPKFYEFDTATDTIIQSGLFFASETSQYWNASIAANANNDVFVTWSSTDPPPDICIQAQVRISGREASDPLGVIEAGSAVFTSPTFYTEPDSRWGDYSAVTLDPLNPREAWVVNETIMDSITWGSWIQHIGF